MKRIFTFTMLFALCSLSMLADFTGVRPESGNAYFIYNVGQQKYLTITSTGDVELNSTGTQFSITKDASTGYYKIANGSDELYTSFNGDIKCASTLPSFYCDELNIAFVSGNICTLSFIEEEDAYSYSYLYYSNATEGISKTSALPASTYTNGEWLFIGSAGDDNPAEKISEITFDENASEITIPEYMEESVTVYLNMEKRTAGKKSTICLPFNMDYSQLCASFGAGTKLYTFRDYGSNKFYYSYRDRIVAGTPYIIIPGSVSGYDEENNRYKVEGVASSSLTTETSPVSHNGWTLNPCFLTSTLPVGSCAYEADGVFRKIKSEKALPAFQAYFVSTSSLNSNSKVLPGAVFEDEWETVIEDIEASNESHAVYNVNGQLVRQNSDNTNGLAKGVYIVNGKKMMIK